MKDVTGASQTVSKSSTSRYACMAAMLVAFFFLVSLSSGGGSSKGDSLRSGQAKRPTIHGETALPVDTDTTTGGGKSGTKAGTKDFDDGDEQGTEFSKGQGFQDIDADEVVDEAESAFRKIVREQLGKNQEMIEKSTQEVMGVIRQGLEEILGDGDIFDHDDILKFGNTIESKLVDEVATELRLRTDSLLEDKVVDMEDAVDLDTEGETKGAKEPVDLTEEEKTLEIQVRNGVDSICAQVKGELKHRAAVIEQDMVQIGFKEKTGESYQVEIDDNDNVVGFQQKTATTSSTKPKKSKKIKKTSHHHSSSHHTPKKSSSGHHSTSSGHKSSKHHSTKKVDKVKEQSVSSDSVSEDP